jgi:hypothetical protein
MRGLAAGHERTNPTSTAKRRLSTLILAAIVGLDLLRAGVQLYELKPGAAKSSLRVRGRFGRPRFRGWMSDLTLQTMVFAIRCHSACRCAMGTAIFASAAAVFGPRSPSETASLLDRWFGRPLATRTPLE